MELHRLPIRFFFSLLVLSFHISSAATVLKFNAGGLKILDYDPDPSSLITGANMYFRGPSQAGLKVGTSHRWGNGGGFVYNIPSGNGVYDVDLIFAEVFPPTQGIGQRIFDVSIEDEIVLKSYDVYKDAGANKEITKSFTNILVEDDDLSIAFLKGPNENPMVSALIIQKSDGSDISIGDVVMVEGVGKPIDNKDFDHQAHAVAGGPYVETDFNSDGFAKVELDGTLSHSHYNNPDTKESGKIVSYEWISKDEILSKKKIFTANFAVGITDVQLKVTDQTGDVASAPTQVKVLPSSSGGAYCYFYGGQTELPKQLKEDPKPEEGHSSNVIDFDDDDFLYTNKEDAPGDAWAARCLTEFSSAATKQYTFSVKYQGAGMTLYINGGAKVISGPSEKEMKTVSATVTVGKGPVPIQILYYKSKDTKSSFLSLSIDGKIATPAVLGFKASDIIPTISSISVKSVNPEGGTQMHIFGTGFFNKVMVDIGNQKDIDYVKISYNELKIKSIPSQAQAGGSNVDIVISNKAGSSNAFELVYSETANAGVAWEQTYLKANEDTKYSIKQITCLAIGPDSNYYLGSMGSFVAKLVVGKDLIVKSSCNSETLGDSRTILGLAFNYASPKFRVYVSTNSLYWNYGGPFENKAEGWANGAIETLVNGEGCSCLCAEEKIITGLPVSNHDHGVNSLMFVNGDLLFSVGGFTNAGHNTPGNKLGGISENPLSGAIVIAKLSKGASFNGKITYDQYDNPETAKQTGGDVETYATGFRNCFGMTQHTNGKIWATDNGGNFNYGDISTGCGEDDVAPFGSKQFDEVNLVEKGKFYGHPNRNRKQCAFGKNAVTPKALVVSSTTGVVEYTSNAFSGTLKGELILSKYAASGSGVTWRTAVTNEELELGQMTEYSGLNIVNGLHGELIMPRMQQGFVAVLKPMYTVPSGPMVIAVSPRKGFVGATVFVSGENFAEGLSVKFGTETASVVSIQNKNGFFCKVPKGSGKVAVVVSLDGVSSEAFGVDFVYV